MKYIKRGKSITTGYCIVCRDVCNFNCIEVTICPEVMGGAPDEISD